MPGEIYLSTAYFPPVEYFSLIKNADEVIIEKEENYPRQTYRNRCRILTSSGTMNLSVPVTKTGLPKIATKDVIIDYSKRWQGVHLGALTSAYNRSPFFQYYFGFFEPVLLKNHKYLLDLNTSLMDKCLDILKLKKCISYTSSFSPCYDLPGDFRFTITPKLKSEFRCRPYIQVFGNRGFTDNLSILDLLFNSGPDAGDYL